MNAASCPALREGCLAKNELGIASGQLFSTGPSLRLQLEFILIRFS